jgi:hypothetical protein
LRWFMPSSRHKGVTSRISRVFLVNIFGISNAREPASDAAFRLVPGGGVEPPRPEGRRILSPLRLPVPPSRLFVEVTDSKAYFTFYAFVIQDNDCETVQVNVEVFMDFHRSLSPACEVLRGSSRATMSLAQAITRTSVRDFTTQRSHCPISK